MMTTNSRRWVVLAWLPAFLLVPLAALLVNAWNQLPARIATHFNFQGVPDGWSSKAGFFAAIAPTLLVPALLGYMAYRIGLRRRLAGAFMLMAHYFTAMVLAYAVIDTVRYNLTNVARPVSLLIFAFVVPILIGAFLIGIDWRWWLKSGKAQMAPGRFIALERHSATVWLWIFLPIALAMLVLEFFVPGPAKTAPIIVAAAMVFAGIWVWRGFEYRFTTSCIEVRMLWLRLRRIPLQEITKYEAQSCSPLFDFGGWGIKGFANETAYIWGGRRVLRIETPRGTVYLGHEHPERLAQDLDMAMSKA